MVSKKCIKAIKDLIEITAIYIDDKHLCTYHNERSICDRLGKEREVVDKLVEELEKECSR